MKKLFALLSCAAAFSCCTDSIIEDEHIELAEEHSVFVNEDHKVTPSDILVLSKGQNSETRSSEQIEPSIEYITDGASDTVLYISIRPSGGWTIYSSDTRVPAIVAQSDRGSFEELMQIDGARLWIQSLAEDMAVIKNLPDEELNFSKEEIANNTAFWKSISSPDEYIKENLLPTTKALKDSITLVSGHYEYSYSTSYTEDYDSISSMITTYWHQLYPYNQYCPLKSDNSEKAPAGCVAIAGAQMLYFLHKHYGVPTTAPSKAYCDGNINSYTWAQTNYTTDIWEYMDYGLYAAPLIADVGRRVSMKYGDRGSSAHTEDLVNKVFAPYGISCIYTTYNTELLKSSLINGMPVLLRASAKTEDGTTGHAFIADKYKRTQTVTINYYEWINDSETNDKPSSLVPEKIEYKYSSPTINMIGMNWGWGYYQGNDNEWFSLTGDWICTIMPSYNWTIYRHMIYGFQPKN